MLVRRWLDAAGIFDPALRAAYTVTCRRGLSDRAGVTWLGVMSVPPHVRPLLAAGAMVVLEADARADEGPHEQRLERFEEWVDAWYAALASGSSADPILHAAAHAHRVAPVKPTRALMEQAFSAPRRDLSFREFPTYADWQEYAAGSAGAAMVWSLCMRGEYGESGERIIREYGYMAQLVDCLADVSEDARDGRLYLPLEDLDRFGVRREDLEAGRWTPAMAALVAFEVARIIDRMPAVLEMARAHPWLYPFCSALDEYIRRLCTAVVEAGPSLLRRVAVPPTGPMVRGGMGLWRSAHVSSR
ncbi:phytoene/squalene synthase family protein [Kitasatospora aureofaciens]|uniref:phytoene/squalene synthase family protein n=1 Tax=Kitasatospora aureofaciens TaxID=1894 RepID=UPI0007C52C23|nr:squalene/phytoene synthase family protein [Kitasatospora aureofaciens]